MLALDRPLGVISGLALFGDHADENRVYYVQTRPRVARLNGEPELSFIKYRGRDAAEGGVGLFSFTTELAASDESLDEARDHLVDLGIQRPVLTQTPWLGGKAVFAAALAEGDRFVEKMLAEVTPDLIGSNRAMFSATLSEEGADLVEALIRMEEGANPLGVRYELEYAGLRPALEVRIRADYKRVYDELSWGFQLGASYEGIGVRVGVESATQKLVESGAIQVEVLHFTDDADLQSRVDKAVRWFQDRILEELFESSLQPPAHENLLQRAIDAATALGAANLQEAVADTSMAGELAQILGISPDMLGSLASASDTRGAGGAAGSESSFALQLQFALRDIRQEELKMITLDWSEARAERRTAAPQGLLSRIGPAPRIVVVDESDDIWDRLKVNVRPLGDFEALGVQRMVVQLAYPDEDGDVKSFTFASGDSPPESFEVWTDGNPPRYRARTEVHFDSEGAWPGPPVHIGDWQTRRSLELAVHPLSDVPRVEIEISPGTVQFEETPQVQIDLRIDGGAPSSHMLSAVQPTATYRRRLQPASGAGEASGGDDAEGVQVKAAPLVEARPIWFLAEGGKVEGDWAPVEGTTLLVHRPWRSQRAVRLFPLLPDDFMTASVTVTLSEHGRARAAEVQFNTGERGAKTVVLPSLSEDAPPLRVDVLVIRGDGSPFIGEPFETTSPVILVRDRDGDQRQVRVRLLAGARLADHGVIAVQVQLLGDGDEVVDQVVFSESKREPAVLLAPVAEDGVTSFRYRVVRYGLDGRPVRGAAEVADVAELLVMAAAPT
ncbi:hypothetical protein [Thiocapsa bogorovii]|uniref:hypothetical protein n=1 Tax=Thiocapsa bogorovii TaxID=521689 RepID=UPI001E4F12F7|nr:hypothetical protein [Thiocapsa bogorovii]UHD15078.1 hypothetical protein LT988_17565 [Thiocapsa bogorovii]